MDMQHSLSYDIDLSGEPSGISAYMVLPADTTQESQNLGLMVERLCSECAIAARVRQYYGGNREDFYDLLRWTTLNVSEDNALTISVDKPAVQAGGKTILELKMTSSNSLPFVSGAKVAITNPWTIQTLLVPQNHVATICDGGDDYRFGFNGQEKDNEVKGLGNSLNFDARIYDDRSGRWLSLDPLAFKYPFASPFNFTLNNPIWFLDKDGREVFIFGSSSSEAFIALQSKTSLKLNINEKTGQVNYTGTPKTKIDKELARAIDPSNIQVNLFTGFSNSFIGQDGYLHDMFIGGNDGSEMDTRTVDGKKEDFVSTIQHINMEHSKTAEDAGVSTKGSDVLHEVMESFYQAEIAPGQPRSEKKFNKAHSKALKLDKKADELIVTFEKDEAGLTNQENGKKVMLRKQSINEKKELEATRK